MYRDDNVGTNGDSTPMFSHTLGANETEPDEFYTDWRTSPFADDYVGRLAEAAIDGLELGQTDRTDYLAVGFSGADYVGHEFGPRSLEVQEHFVQLDATIGRLLDHLDRVVGAGRYVVALSADHGVAPIPEWAAEQGFDAGRIVRGEMVDRVNEALVPSSVQVNTRLRWCTSSSTFAPGVYDRLLADPRAMQSTLDANCLASRRRTRVSRRGVAIRRSLGPTHATGGGELLPGSERRPGSGAKPYWYTWIRGADHGTGYDYDTRVPLILMGSGIAGGRYRAQASPTDIAPTLAALTGVTLARTDGRVLVKRWGHWRQWRGNSPGGDADDRHSTFMSAPASAF